MNYGASIPFFVTAEIVATPDFGSGFYSALLNYGALGIWVAFMIYRDYRESNKQDKRHEENLEAFKRIEDAYRTNTDLMIVGLGGVKNMDSQYTALLEKLKSANAPK